jgi:hypothetical protein
MYTRVVAWASSATYLPMSHAVGFRMAMKHL